MSISLLADRTRRVVLDAMLVALAMMLSYLEVLLPLELWLPLPGFRLGLANFLTVTVFSVISKKDVAVISGARILLMGLLFGSVTSLYFSAMGGLFSFLTLLLLSKIGTRCSYFGVSILSAAAHNCGQLTAAVTLFGTSLISSYLPFLLIAALICGGTVGLLLNLCVPKLQRALKGWWIA